MLNSIIPLFFKLRIIFIFIIFSFQFPFSQNASIDGLNILLSKGTKDAKKLELLEKVGLIASVAGWNTNLPFPAVGKNFTYTVDENDILFTSTESHTYAQAKFIANQTVEKFIEDNPNTHFEISSVSPMAVMGKSLSKREDSTATGLQFLIKNNMAPNDFMQALYYNDVPYALVDVDDVANAIYKLATIRGFHGKNYLLSRETYKISNMQALLNQDEPKEKPSIVYKNDLAKTDLGIHFKPVKSTLNQYSN